MAPKRLEEVEVFGMTTSVALIARFGLITKCQTRLYQWQVLPEVVAAGLTRPPNQRLENMCTRR